MVIQAYRSKPTLLSLKKANACTYASCPMLPPHLKPLDKAGPHSPPQSWAATLHGYATISKISNSSAPYSCPSVTLTASKPAHGIIYSVTSSAVANTCPSKSHVLKKASSAPTMSAAASSQSSAINYARSWMHAKRSCYCSSKKRPAPPSSILECARNWIASHPPIYWISTLSANCRTLPATSKRCVCARSERKTVFSATSKNLNAWLHLKPAVLHYSN